MAFSRPADNSSGTFVNTTSLEEQFLRCTICNEKFDQNMRVLKQLSCNHTFCKQCLISVINAAPPPLNALKCPTCRSKHWIGDSEVQYLPTDHRTIQMMDFLSAAEKKQTKDVCQKHPGEILKFFCRKCEVPICRDCPVTLHKAHGGHDIIDLSQAFKELTPKFNNTRDQANVVMRQLKMRLVENATYTKDLDKDKSNAKEEIEKTFAEYHLVLEKRKAQLLAEIDEKINSLKSNATSQNNAKSPSLESITLLHDKFEEATKRQDVGQLVILSRQIDELVDSVKGTNNPINDCTFIFQEQGEKPFKDQACVLGKITEASFFWFHYERNKKSREQK